MLKLVVLAVAAGCVWPSLASAGSAGWSTPVSVAQLNLTNSVTGLTAVSCPEVGTCVAVDADGNAYTYSDGTWSKPVSIDGDQVLTGVSCPTALFCVAVDSTGHAIVDNGGTWSAPEQVDSGDPWSGPELTAVSCVSSSFCVADNTDGGVDDVGSTWTADSFDIDNNSDAVSCVSAGYCLSVDGVGRFETYNGSSWTDPSQVIVPFNGDHLVSVSCVTSAFCMAGDTAGHAYVIDGDTASAPVPVVPGASSEFDLVGLPGISCVSTSFCVAVDSSGNAYTFGGTNWSEGVNFDPAGAPTAVSCASASFCAAVDSAGQASIFSGVPQVPPRLLGLPVMAARGAPYTAPVGVFEIPVTNAAATAAPSAFDVTVDWGDGSAPVRGTVLPESVLNGGTTAGFDVTAPPHTFSKLTAKPHLMRVTVTLPGGTTLHASPTVFVDDAHPQAAFVVNPNNPRPDGIALFMPQLPLTNQWPIAKYEWTFLDGYRHVIDDASTRPRYERVIKLLIAHPADTRDRDAAIALGILPEDANGQAYNVPLPVGTLVATLPAQTVREIAETWQAYFPKYHVVPHYFDYDGRTGVRLVTTDASPAHRETYDQTNVSVSKGCAPWGGPLAPYWGDYTTCDTIRGVQSQFGPRRTPDYVFINLSRALGTPAKLGFDYGIGLTITRGALTDAAGSTFLTVFLQEGVSARIGAGITQDNGLGWVGPPDPANTPKDSDVDNFVDGVDIYGGFSVGLLNLGLGWNAVLSPSQDQGGEELYYSGGAQANIGATVAESCSAPLSTSPAAGALQTIFKDAAKHEFPSGSTLIGLFPGLPSSVSHALSDLTQCL